MRDHRPYERIVLARNPRYYDASLVGLDELTFLPITDGTTVMNLYKAGQAALTPGLGLSPLLTPVLSRQKDFHSTPAFGTVFPCISTRTAPFDNVLLRYALNMATDKTALANLYGSDYLPARSLIAPMPEYTRPDNLHVEVDGRSYDVLSFDMQGARSLWLRLGFRAKPRRAGAGSRFRFTFPSCPALGHRANHSAAVASSFGCPCEADCPGI